MLSIEENVEKCCKNCVFWKKSELQNKTVFGEVYGKCNYKLPFFIFYPDRSTIADSGRFCQVFIPLIKK